MYQEVVFIHVFIEVRCGLVINIWVGGWLGGRWGYYRCSGGGPVMRGWMGWGYFCTGKVGWCWGGVWCWENIHRRAELGSVESVLSGLTLITSAITPLQRIQNTCSTQQNAPRVAPLPFPRPPQTLVLVYMAVSGAGPTYPPPNVSQTPRHQPGRSALQLRLQ